MDVDSDGIEDSEMIVDDVGAEADNESNMGPEDDANELSDSTPGNDTLPPNVPPHLAYRPSWAGSIPKPLSADVEREVTSHPWLGEAFKPLQKVVIGFQAYRHLVQAWILLERDIPVCNLYAFKHDGSSNLSEKAGSLPILCLPESPSSWIQAAEDALKHRHHLPDNFSLQWCAWWTSLQPASRLVAARGTQAERHLDLLLHPASIAHAEWNTLRVGGPQGIYFLVYALGLCNSEHSNSTGMSDSEWTRWVYDMMWALNSMKSEYLQGRSKRQPSMSITSHDDSGPSNSPSPTSDQSGSSHSNEQGQAVAGGAANIALRSS